MKSREIVLVAALVSASLGACYTVDDAPFAPTLGSDPTMPGAANAQATPPYAATESYAAERARRCRPARASETIPQRRSVSDVAPVATFAELSSRVVNACGGCHLAPAERGGFSFQAAYHGTEIPVDGTKRFVPGLFEAAPRITAVVLSGKMPPANIRGSDARGFDELGALLRAWADGGKPDGTFALPRAQGEGPSAKLPASIGDALTPIGDCVPEPSAAGSDPAVDARFATMRTFADLPDRLDETDLPSLDTYALARRGTFAYAPAYPLWSDDAKKQRWIHVPVDPATGARRGVTYNPEAKNFDIPENTRFYKTFFKQVVEADGRVAYRKVETRLIVVRHPWQESLFGSYRWNATEDGATLVRTPYRNGEPFKDTPFSIETDEGSHATRRWLIPARHRCLECHQGSEGQNFVLGFTPLQLNRRRQHEGGVDAEVGDDELDQVTRLVSYGVLRGLDDASQLPRLEAAGTTPPHGDRELSAQAYLVGNCSHCHNPQGFAPRQDERLRALDFRAGGLSSFPVATRGASTGNQLVSAGNPAGSELFVRVSKPTQLVGAVAVQHMPLHTGGIDCRAVRVLGKWIAGIPILPGGNATADQIHEAERAADERANAFDPACTPPADVDFLEEDFTEPAVYEPRRADWADPQNGMPDSIRRLEESPGLAALASTPIPVGYWNKKPGCSFPAVETPPDGTRPWMVDGAGRPKRPYGEVFYQTAGAHYFAAVCQRCHGPRANGDSGIAKLLARQSGGTVRVANLMDGLFARGGANLKLFDVVEDGGTRNLAGNYVVWMAGGGTKVAFPPGFTDLVGPYGPNMLARVRDQFKRLLPGHADPYPPYYQTYEMFQRVATLDNPIVPETGYGANGEPLDAARQEAWLDRAQANAGWVLFRFFRDEAARGNWPLSPDQCDVHYGAPAVP